MAEWVERLDAFLQFNERNILDHAGSVSHELAERHALDAFERHEAEHRQLAADAVVSDFDRVVQDVRKLGDGGAPGSDERQG